MAYSAHDRNGEFIKNPSLDQMRALLASLKDVDPELPDVALKHESEWSISVFGSGLVLLENVGTGEGPWNLREVSMDRALELWQKLAAGNIAEIRALPWSPGNG